MPIYLYQVLLEDDIEGPTFEFKQSPDEPALTIHPVTGHKVRRLPQLPNISTKHTPSSESKLKDNAFLEKKGFSKYERDKLTGKYNKVAGKEGPVQF